MDAGAALRLISLIPERRQRRHSGSAFNDNGLARIGLLCRLMHWLTPLQPVGNEEQQALGLRVGGGKAPVEGHQAGEEPAATADEVEEAPLYLLKI
jgi:hypothetical protein